MLSEKESFIEYLKIQSEPNSGKPHSYAKAMEVLEDVLFEKNFSRVISIWNFINNENISHFYEFIKEQQKITDGIFKNYEPSSYWKNGYCSAALKEFGKYIDQKTKHQEVDVPSSPLISSNKPFDVSDFVSLLNKSNLMLHKILPHRFTSSILTKPFVILTGLSGSGKTKLAEAFSLWISESNNQYCMVSVGADWTNREPILGYPNALESGKYVKPDNGVLDLILNAELDPDKPYFLILDEMNMSHVERYFADFLSAMESTDRTITLHPEGEEWKGCDVPASLILPKNLFIIGTVNIDETTYMFSPKVLDRANVIEFRVSDTEMESFFESPKNLDLNVLRGTGASMANDFMKTAIQAVEPTNDLKDKLMPFFNSLQKAGAEFGYRTASEMNRFITICNNIPDKKIDTELPVNVMSSDEIIDAAIIQKLLPKVHGSRNKIEPILKDLAKLCLEVGEEPFQKDNGGFDLFPPKYPLSYEKLERMYYRVISDGFTSFAEA